MDRKLEKSYTDKILRRFAKGIAEQGFIRTKPTFFVRESGHLIEFIHTHKYTFGPCFRLHICLRVLNDPREFVSLSGPIDRELSDNCKFEFTESIESIDSCAAEMVDFVVRYAEPWYKQWHNPSTLLASASPLQREEKLALESAINGNSKVENQKKSRAVLKIA